MKKVSISLFISLLAVMAFAQPKPDNLFKIIISSGDNTIVKNGKWETLKIGTQLTKNDQVRVEGFLGLQHISGKTIEIKTPGTYKVADLVAKVPAGNSNLTQRYADFVVTRMKGNNGSGTNQNATGASERGDYLFANLPYKKDGGCIVMGDKLVLHWIKDPQRKTKNYIVRVEDLYGEKVFVKTLTDTTLSVDLTKLKPNEMYNLHIQSKENSFYSSEDNPYTIQKLDAKTEKEVMTELADFDAYKGELTAMNSIVLGSFYEQKKMYANALEYYEKAVKLEPDVTDFKKVLDEFIQENHIGNPNQKKKTK